MNRNVLSRLVWVVVIAVAFAAGSKVARNAKITGMGDRGDPSPAESATESASDSSGSVRQGSGGVGSWEEAKQRIVDRWEASPAVTLDFELRDETMRTLEKTPDADLEAWMRALRSTQWTDEDKDVPFQLREMILMVLARRGGGSFIRSLEGHPIEGGWSGMEEAMGHWIRHDPAAALDWLDGSVPEVIEGDLGSYREDALELLAGRDPAEFERRLARVDAETREEVLERYALRRGDPEGRAGLLERAANAPQGEAMALWSGLLRREGSEDPARAYRTLAELDISPEDRAALDQSLVFWLMYPASFSSPETDKGGVIQGWMDRNPGEMVPDGIRDSFERWSQGSPGRATAWVAGQASGPRYDVFAKVIAAQRTGEPGAVAEIVERIGDAALRSSIQRELKKSWQEMDPIAADEWERNLPEADRERLK
jgi:hypothetical protein